MAASGRLSRRDLLKRSGALVVGFSLAGCASPPPAAPAVSAPPPTASQPPTGVALAPSAAPAGQPRRQAGGTGELDSWLIVGQDESVTVLSGKVELGTGVRTALAQIVAEELEVPVGRVTMVMGDTARAPDQGYTAGSKTIQSGAVALRRAGAEARLALLELAAARLGAPLERLEVRDGVVSVQGEPARRASYGELIGGRRFERQVSGQAPTRRPEQYAVVGTSVPRVELPGKVGGAASYVHDLRLPGLLHGRVIRPPGPGATLASVDEASIAGQPGLVKIVRRGSFLGVVAEREEQAIRAARELKATWQGGGSLPSFERLHEHLRGLPGAERSLASEGDVEAALDGAAQRLSAVYTWPYQSHASLGPSCAVADVGPDQATIWSATQGVYQLRGALAELLGRPAEQLRVIHLEGAGCYGHNGADDVAADAALLSQAVGRPVRVQWSRADEHAWAPHGPAMVMELRGGLDAEGAVVAWDFVVWTPPHTSRPGGAANLLAGRLVNGSSGGGRGGGGGDRNARHDYRFPNNRVRSVALSGSPLRTSAFRGLGGPANTFANESFLDELAAAAGADPLDFRLRHLNDPRAAAVLRACAERFGWPARPAPAPPSPGPALGRGLAFARYENANAYVAVAAEVEVERADGRVRVRRLVAGHDCGLIVNPDGLANQVEGNLVQATSRALKEQVTFDRASVTSVDWRGYPILTFSEVPEVEVVLLDRPDQPPVGAGEPATLPVAPAIANAIFDATGARVRAVPFTPERIKAVLAW